MNEHARIPEGEEPSSTQPEHPAPAPRRPLPAPAPKPGVLACAELAAAGGAPERAGLLARLARLLPGRAAEKPVATTPDGDIELPKNAKVEALPRVPGQPEGTAYALVARGLPLPPGGVAYLVCAEAAAVAPGSGVQVAAYIDLFGRVFSVGSVQAMPPAREPELQFMRYTDKSPNTGCIEVSTGRGKTARLAEYREEPPGTFAIVSSRVDLAGAGEGRALRAACAVAFLAFWLFPRRNGVSLAALSVRDALAHLRTNNLFEALEGLLADARQAEEHPLLLPPGLIAYTAYNLRKAGLEGVGPRDLAAQGDPFARVPVPMFPVMPGLSVAGVPVPGVPAPGPMGGGSGLDLVSLMRQALEAAGIPGLSVLGGAPGGTPGEPLVRFIRTSMYANTFYVGFDRAQVSPEGARKLLEAESVLNRFVFALEELDRVGMVQSATFGQVAELDAWIVDTVARHAWAYLDGEVEGVEREDSGSVGLDVRFAFARGCEKLRMPFRLEYGFRFDVAAGELVVDVECPSSELMPRVLWEPQAGAWRERTYAEREGLASRYALHLVGVLAAVAFWAHGAVQRATVNCWHGLGASAGVDELARLDNGTLRGPAMQEPACVATASFARAEFAAALAEKGRRDAFERDPAALVEKYGAFELDADGHLCRVEPLRSLADPSLHPAGSNKPPELDDRALDERGAELLHARTVRDLGIFEDAPRKAMAEEIVAAFDRGGAEAAMETALDVYDRTENLLVRQVAVDVRDRIALGAPGASSGEAVTAAFSDVYGLQAGMKGAHRLVKSDPAAACKELQRMIDLCDERLWFADTGTRKYRYFDSYATRAVYAVRHPEAADGRELRLCPDEYYLCHYRLAQVMAESLDHAEDAIVHARRCVELAPTVAASHLRLARCYFSVFDYVSEIDVIKGMLRLAWNPADIAMGLYWLGYAFCMVDKHEVGAACYQQAAVFDPGMAESAAAELGDFMRKIGQKPRKLSDEECDALLAGEGIDLAWVEQSVVALVRAAGAATDAEAFGLARNLLNAAQLVMRDDALAPVLESLEE